MVTSDYGSTNNGYIYISTNYGSTYTAVGQFNGIPDTGYSGTDTASQKWKAVAMSDSGSVIYALYEKSYSSDGIGIAISLDKGGTFSFGQLAYDALEGFRNTEYNISCSSDGSILAIYAKTGSPGMNPKFTLCVRSISSGSFNCFDPPGFFSSDQFGYIQTLSLNSVKVVSDGPTYSWSGDYNVIKTVFAAGTIQSSDVFLKKLVCTSYQQSACSWTNIPVASSSLMRSVIKIEANNNGSTLMVLSSTETVSSSIAPATTLSVSYDYGSHFVTVANPGVSLQPPAFVTLAATSDALKVYLFDSRSGKLFFMQKSSYSDAPEEEEEPGVTQT